MPGALAATAQGICPRALANRAAGVTRTVALCPWSLPGAGRTPDGPVSEYGRAPGPGRARAAGPGVRSSRAGWPGGKVPAAGQLVGRTVYTPRVFRDRLAQSNRGERGRSWPWRAPPPQPRRSRWRRALCPSRRANSARGHGPLIGMSPGELAGHRLRHRAIPAATYVHAPPGTSLGRDDLAEGRLYFSGLFVLHHPLIAGLATVRSEHGAGRSPPGVRRLVTQRGDSRRLVACKPACMAGGRRPHSERARPSWMICALCPPGGGRCVRVCRCRTGHPVS